LADRRLPERAKGIIRRRCGLDEQAAYRSLQRVASNHKHNLVQAAQTVFDAGHVPAELEGAESRGHPAPGTRPAGSA
jgi:AmiR/NasT family two-component response regulator